MANTKLKVIYGDVVLGVHGKDFSYLFSYQAGGMESLVYKGREWLYRPPRPAFWRATTDNDKGNGFAVRSGMWMAADMFSECKEINITVDDMELAAYRAPENNRFQGEKEAEKVKISYLYETVTCPITSATITYEVSGDGTIKTEVCYKGKEGLPQLPVFGIRLIMPTVAEGYRYLGLSGETYPDRRCGGKKGIYEIEGLPVTPYLVPQDCGMHMDTEWLEIYRTTTLRAFEQDKTRFGIRIEACGEPFAFSCIPYTPVELESATHQEELPPARRTVLMVCGAVRGVGGIDSWGADVEETCQIDAAKDIRFAFQIKGMDMAE